MDNYPVSIELKKAIETIFEDQDQAYLLLGTIKPLGKNAYQEAPSREMQIPERAKMLKTKIENFIMMLAKDYEQSKEEQELLDDLNDESLNFNVKEKIDTEARVFLMILRLLFQYIPESFE